MNLFLKINIEAKYLIEASLVFTSVAAGILVFIAYYILVYIKDKRKVQHLRNVYNDFLSEIILCETKEELLEVMEKPYVQSIKKRWLWDQDARRLLIKEVVKINKSLSGMSSDNIQWLYMNLELYNDSLKRLGSKKWYVKAKAIQELAAMHQMDYIAKIYRETNSKNNYIRKEAQLAVVKLTGIEGLRFLNVLSHPISQWQQISLLEQLPDYALIEEEKVSKWLLSGNDSVAELALRLIEKFSLFELHDAAVMSLIHPADLVGKQAVRTLIVVQNETTASKAAALFAEASTNARLNILNVLKEIGTKAQLSILLPATEDENDIIRLSSRQLVRRWEPAYLFSDERDATLLQEPNSAAP